MTPKVFISHASEDKERFVTPFATALRANGVDAWVDKWEIKLGDSLVQKIFSEGIGQASAAILVLSPISVSKPWVIEELDSAFVARLERQLRLIPVLIEPCEIPAPLRHLTRVELSKVGSIDGIVEAVVRTLFDQSGKPALGSAPAYSAPARISIPGLTQSDSHVLLEIGNIYLEQGHGNIGRRELESRLKALDMTSPLVAESLEILDSEGLVDGKHAIGMKYALVSLTSWGGTRHFPFLFPILRRRRSELRKF